MRNFQHKNFPYRSTYANIKNEKRLSFISQTKAKRMWNINQLLRKSAIFGVLKVFTNMDKEDEKYAKNEEGKMS